MPSVPMPDADSAAMLHGARVDAQAALQGRAPTMASPIPPPSVASAMPTRTSAPAAPVGPSAGLATSSARAADLGPPAYLTAPQTPADYGPGADLVPMDPWGGSDGPGADVAAPADAKTTPSMFAGLGSAVGNGLMRGFVGMGRVIGLGGAPLVEAATLGNTNAMDAYFRGLDGLVDGAMQHWQPGRPVGAGSQVLGSVAEGLAPMTTGDLGMVVGAGVNSAADSVKAGEDLKTATKVALVTAGATAAGLRLPLKSPVLWRRLATGVLGMPAISDASKALIHKILADNGYQRAAAQVNWADPKQNAVDALMGAIFGAVARPEIRGKFNNAAAGERPAAGATPPPAPALAAAPSEGPGADLALPDEEPEAEEGPAAALAIARIGGTDVPVQVVGDAGNGQSRVRLLDEAGEPGEEQVIPSSALSGAVQPSGEIRLPGQQPGTVPGPSAAPTEPVVLQAATPGRFKIPDRPSAEPLLDLQAQIADMQDPASARRAVYLSPDNVSALGPDGVSELAEGMKRIPNFDHKGGVLIVPDAATARAARDLRAAQPDMQKVLGQLTGAGNGKSLDNTAVVQARTPMGAVASETSVRPGEVPGVVARVAASGKTPVVTTPEGAVQRRAEMVAQEAQPNADDRVRQNYGDFLGKTARRFAMEGRGREVLDDMEETGRKPNDVAKQFWSKTYFQLPPEVQVRFRRELENHSGLTTKALEEHPEKLQQAINDIDLPNSVEHLEGTDRGFAVLMDEANRRFGQQRTEPEGTDAPLEPLGRGPWNPETDPLELRSPLKQLPSALVQLEQQETSAPGKKFPAKLPVRQDNASAFAAALKSAAIEARGSVPDEVVHRAAAAAKAAERLTHMTPEMINKGMGTSHTRVSAIIDEMKKAARLLMGKSEAGDEVTISQRAAQLKARLVRNAARAARVTDESPQRTAAKPSAPENPGVITVQPLMFRGRAMQGLAQELGFDPDTILKEGKPPPGQRHGTISAFLREAAGGLGPNDGWMPYMSALNPLRSKASPLTRSEHIRLGNLIERFATADAEGAGEARGNLEAFMNNVRGKRLDEKTQAAVHEYAQARRRMELDRQHEDSEEDTAPGESVYVEDEQTPTYHGYLPEDLDEMAAGSRYADHLWGDIARKLDEKGFTRQLERMRDQGTPASLHGLLDLAGQHAESQFARTIIHAIRRHVVDTPVRALDRLEPPEGQSVGPNTAGLHIMGLGRNEIQIRTNHPFAHPLRVLLHEAVHAATSAHLRMEPLSEFSQEIEQLWHTARDRTERMLGRPLAPTDYAKGHLYGLKNVREFMAEALSNERFISHLIDSEKYATPGEKLRNIVSRIGEALRKLFGIHKGPEAKLFHNVVFATARVMRAQSEKNDFLQRMFAPGEHTAPPSHDALSTATQLQALHDALEVEGDPQRQFRGEDRIMRDVPEALRPVLEGLRYYSGAKLDSIRKSVRAWASYDQLIRRGLRHFGSSDDAQNPLRAYDETRAQRATVQNRAIEKSVQVAERWARLPADQSHQLGAFMRDTTIWGIDPRKPLSEHTAKVQTSTRAVRKYDEFAKRWQALTPEQRRIYTEAENDNRRMAKLSRKTVIDTVLRSVESNISPAQRSLLYAVRDPRQFDALIGEGAPVDLGEFNSMVRETLKDLSPLTELEGPYFHLGREGSKVVQVTPEGEKQFATKGEAEAFMGRVRELGPTSTAKLTKQDDGWHVEYKAKYVSMHGSRAEAEADAARMQALGFDVGPVTEKQISRENSPVTEGTRGLLAEAERKIGRFGANDEQDAATNEALLKTLRSTFAQMLAARSERAAGTLARRGVAGVKPEEMRMAYARHAMSSASGIGTMSTLFDEANALGRLREAARNPEIGNASQQTMYARGLLLHELGKRIGQDAEDRATRGDGINRMLAHASFLNYIVSPAHALIWATQNVTTGIPVAGARYGYFRAMRAFGKGMGSPALPAMRETLRGLIRPGSMLASDVSNGVLAALRKDPALGRWTGGANSPMLQLAERGALTSTLTNEMASFAHINGGSTFGKVEQWARLLPHLADLYNRVSTAIAGLELTNGDVAKTHDLINEIHVDYASENKPRAFKAMGRVPPMKTLVLLKTYVQGMTHLLYSNIYDAATGEGKGRAEAAKTVAGLIAGAGLFAGATGAVPEPVRWLIDAWHHMFGDADQYADLDNSMRRWLSDALGHTGGEIAAEGLPRALGVDLSQRMGFSHMLFYDAPDLLGPQSPRDKAAQLLESVAGPLYSMPVEHWQTFQAHARRGETAQAWLSLLPIKALSDAQKAYSLATGGYQSSTVQLPGSRSGGWQDSMQAVGFRPESVANASERAQTVYQYRQWAYARKAEILGQFLAAKDRASVEPEIEKWNKANPGMLITRSDLIRAARGQYRAQRLGAGLPDRDPIVNRLLNY